MFNLLYYITHFLMGEKCTFFDVLGKNTAVQEIKDFIIHGVIIKQKRIIPPPKNRFELALERVILAEVLKNNAIFIVSICYAIY